ncbi:MAG: VanW family protein [Dysosmobacter sp.]
MPAYIHWGMDATVSWGGPDYKFTNNTDYPIKIVATYSGGYLTVKILGTNVDGTSRQDDQRGPFHHPLGNRL